MQELGEARMFKTRDQIAREGSRTMTDHLFVSLLALYAMSNDYNYAPVAAEYARKTGQLGNYNRPSPSGTDLYQTIYSLQRPDEMFSGDKDEMLMGKVQVDTPKIKRFIDRLKTGNVTSQEASQFFFRLERQMKIQDPKLRAARRLIQDWPTLTTQQQQLASTQLMKHFRLHGRRSDIMPLFSKFAKDNSLVLGTGAMSKIAKKAAEYGAYGLAGYAVGRAIGV